MTAPAGPGRHAQRASHDALVFPLYYINKKGQGVTRSVLRTTTRSVLRTTPWTRWGRHAKACCARRPQTRYAWRVIVIAGWYKGPARSAPSRDPTPHWGRHAPKACFARVPRPHYLECHWLYCYARRFSERFRGVPGHPFESGFDLTLRTSLHKATRYL